jgi:hypothetical protein
MELGITVDGWVLQEPATKIYAQVIQPALPPPQWPMPGERNRRLQSVTFDAPPLVAVMRW